MARLINFLLVFFLLGLLAGTGALFWKLEHTLPPLAYSEFLTMLDHGEVTEVRLDGGRIALKDDTGQEFATYAPDVGTLLPELRRRQVAISAEPPGDPALRNLFTITLPVVLVLLAWLAVNRTRQAPVPTEEREDFARDKMIDMATVERRITFEDVGGIPEAKEELIEIIDFLVNSKKFSRLGANIPRGVLLQGPPGTGKTLLAKAIAGEAGVPFYSFSGSDFVEMFVGVGASRVRDLFREAKKNAPCIVFIDEIDAVGVLRSGAGGFGGQDERGQTLNALLVAMDGFSREDTIIVLAATNRPDILDPALRRPGRFDRQITILPPDVKGRLKILQVHTRDKRLAEDFDLREVARNSPGFTGAELANLVNEAALIAARTDKDFIDSHDFDAAKDRILMGIERKGLVISEQDRKTMAFHEAGHAILARFLPEADPVHKITIIPRGRAMGHTQQLPLNDRHAYTKEYLRNRITILMGGRAAEEIILHQQTTGAENDLLQATEIARKMICRWGMSTLLGPMAFARNEGEFLAENTTQLGISETTARHIDQEVKKLVDTCYQEALEMLMLEKDFLGRLGEILLQTETLDREEIDIIFECSQKKRLEKHQGGSPAECDSCPAAAHCTQRSDLAA
ncbi:MAG: ATP-dependent zinc metalloprotease FtsH [Desulfobacteraceae bacterium]|nr:ATP-dependent zinc metalloprotease FtsH [Desulfobacteraceae bacterium]